MARFDAYDQFSVKQEFTAAAVSTNSKKKEEAAQDLGIGKRQMGLTIFPVAAAEGATSWTIELIQADDGALTSGVESLASMSVLTADLIPDKPLFLPLPPYRMDKEYYGAKVTPVGGSGQKVKLDIYWGSEDDVAQFKAFKSSYNVENN